MYGAKCASVMMLSSVAKEKTRPEAKAGEEKRSAVAPEPLLDPPAAPPAPPPKPAPSLPAAPAPALKSSRTPTSTSTMAVEERPE
jgi:hypothetical protein